MVWLAPDSPRAPLPDLHPAVPLGGDGIATVFLPVLRVEANAAILIDNFLDEAHLPFVHAATIGGAGPEPIPRADVDRRGLSFTAVRDLVAGVPRRRRVAIPHVHRGARRRAHVPGVPDGDRPGPDRPGTGRKHREVRDVDLR